MLRNLHHALVLALLSLGCAFTLRTLRETVLQGRYLTLELGLPWPLLAVALALGALAGLALLGLRALAWRKGRWRAAEGAPFRLLFSIGVLATGVHLIYLQPFRLLFWSLSIALAFGVYAVVLLIGPWFEAPPAGRLVRRSERLLFVLCLLPVALEGALRIVAVLAPSPLTDQKDLLAADLAERYRRPAGEVRMGFPCDRHGYYDVEPSPPPRDGALVAAIGDSFHLSIVPHAQHFTTVCEEALDGVEVYNMGIPAVGPPVYLHLLKTEALALEPAAILISLFVGNDVLPFGLQSNHRLLRLCFDRRNLLLDLVPRRWLRLRAEQKARGGAVGGELDADLGQHASSEQRMPWLEDPLLEEASFSEGLFLDIEVRCALEICVPGESDYGPLMETLQRTLSAAQGVPIGFVLIPDEFQVEDELWERVAARIPERPLERELPQRLLGEWFEARDVPVLDLLPVLRALEPLADGKRHAYHLRDTHFNARGNRAAGLALAEFLQREFALGE